jgi:mRNA interferase MazF
MSVRRGEIYWAEFNPLKGSEQAGIRPALIVQNDLGNQAAPTTIIVAITRAVPARPYPFVVVIDPADSGLPATSAVNCSQLTTIQQDGPDSRLRPPRGSSAVRPIGRLSAKKMAEVDTALSYSLGLP